MHQLLRLTRAVAFAVLVTSSLVVVGAASGVAEAAGTPDIDLRKSMPAEALLGEDIPVTLEIENTTATNGFNTTIRDVLPPGVDYVSGSATPDPVEFTQLDGSTVLVWENLFDSLAGTFETFTYSIRPDATAPDGLFDVFADDPISNQVTNQAEAYTNTDARIVPRPDADGNIVNSTGNDTAAATTTLIPFRIVKSEPSEENELLRGVRDHRTVYTLRIENNPLGPSENFSIIDYLPAGLEFLGCGTVNNSPNVEEYPTQGGINTSPMGLTNCDVPDSVTTQFIDPPGDLPEAVYTVVEWNTGLPDLAAGGVYELQYVAAIPLQENVVTFPDPQPGISGEQGSNLSNNTGPLTTETNPESSLTNEAAATGDYASILDPTETGTFRDTDTETVRVEDISLHKRLIDPSNGNYVHGQTVIYDLVVQTSEYVTANTGTVVEDTLPAGLDFVSSSQTAPTAGPFPPVGPTTPLPPDATTSSLFWNLADQGPSAETIIRLETRVRTTHRDTGEPVSSNDSLTNVAELGSNVTIIGETDPQDLEDRSQTAIASRGPSISKEVSEQVTSPATLDCGDGSGVSFVPDEAGDYRPGDRVCWRLTVTFPTNLDTVEPEVFDVLPDGFTLDGDGGQDGIDDGWQYGANHDSAVDGTFTADGPSLQWQLPQVDPSGRIFEVVIQSVVSDPIQDSDNDPTANLMKFRYRNTAGDVFQERDQAHALIAEPVLDLTKGVVSVDGTPVNPPADGVQVEEGDVVTYQVTVSNATSENTFDVSVRDVLPGPAPRPNGTPASPIQITCAMVSSISSGGTCDPTNNWIQWDSGIDVAAGASADLTYDVTLPVGVSAGATLTNLAGIRQYDGDSNSGNPFTYVPESNVDGTLTPNTDRADDPSSIVTATPTISKGRTSEINSGADGNDNGEATIGETITYTVTLDLPAGVTYFDAVVTDDLDSPDAGQLDLDALSVVATLDVGAGSAPLPAGVVLDVDDPNNTWTVTFPVNYSVPAGPDQQLVVTFDAVVLDVPVNVRNHNTRNRVELAYSDGFGNNRNQRATVGTSIVEPNIEVAKAEDALLDLVAGGVEINYTLTVTNDNIDSDRTSTGYETTVVDTIPPELIVLDGTGGAPVANGGMVGPDGGVWNEAARTITWTIPTIQPDATVTLDYFAETIQPLVAGTLIRNDVDVETTSMPGVVPGERTAASPNGGPGSGYQDTDFAELTARGFALVKTVTPNVGTVGESADYRLTFVIPAEVVGFDGMFIDEIPPGIVFESLTSVSCVPLGGGSCVPDITVGDVTTITATTPPTSGGDVAFFLGDLTAPSTVERVITINYVGVIADVAAANDGSTLTNEARAYWNETDQITGVPTDIPDPGSFDNTSNPGAAKVDTVEPTLTIDKDVVGQAGDTDTRRAVPGEVLTYDLSIVNTGTSPAYDLTIVDVADDDSWAFADVSGARPGLVNTDSDPVGGLEWTFTGPLDPGGTLLITYTLTVPTGFDSSDENPTGPEQTNVADVSSYFGVAEAERTSNPSRNYREYDDVTPDEVTIELDLASIGDRVWFDVDGDGIQDAGEPGLAGIDVLVTYHGPDGIFGNADDETQPVQTTDANGNYLVENLPGGEYTVAVTTDLTTRGLESSFDLDGGTASPNGSWTGSLGEDEDRRDVDFGYIGFGSIGDLIWLDQNLNRVQDLGEDGLGAVDVTVTWFGPDGVAGGGDDINYTATTDVDGAYLVENLPFGDYLVTVDTTDLPADYDNVTDPDGGGDSTSLTSLDAGTPDRLDQDFGYAGAGSIGDTVYLDQDGDGTQDPAEPGIATVVVELVHWGPDGAPGGGDDSSFSTITDANGNYLFENLPGGEYVVTVTGGIALVDNTEDPDGPSPIGDSTSSVTLVAGGDDLDQDFGYFADAVLGDTVWLDLNGDGVVDPGEPGLNGVEITITSAALPGGLTTTTDANGDYIFDKILPNDDYTVAVNSATLPPGVTQTHDFDDPANPTPTTPGKSITRLTDSDLEQDFGYRGAGVIGDTVWLDLDGDGTVNGLEVGLEGASVTLEWTPPSGPPVTLTTTTDANGNYLFEYLPDGDYVVTVDTASLPAGLSPTADADGVNTPNTSAVELSDVTSRVRRDQDFGYNGGGSIGDTIWFDRDRDGVVDADESGLGGVTVELVWQSPTGPQTFTTITTADGSYLFDNLPSGDYTVSVDTGTLPPGLAATFDADGGLDDTSALTLGNGDDDLDQDFGYAGDGSLGDTVFLDLDGDGVQGLSEPGVPGQTVEVIWGGPDGVIGGGDDVTYTTTTDVNGTYTFDNFPPAEYTVTVVGGIVDSASNTADPGGTIGDSTNSITLADGEDNLDQDFGYQGLNSIGDTVWYDVDADGLDGGAASEPRLAGVTVEVVWFGVDGAAGGGDDVALPLATTDASGIYGVSGLPDGSYSVTVTGGLPAGLDDNTGDPDGGGDSTSVVTDLGVGAVDPVADLDQDFGFAGRGSIGDRVWLDLDGDGLQDPDEPGLGGAEVALTWAGPDGTLGTGDDVTYPSQTTGPDGAYVFPDLPAGDFRVDISGTPLGLLPSGDPDGGADDTSQLALAVGETNLDQDFGYVGGVLPRLPTGVGDTIWIDVDGDGAQDPGEPGVPGVSVTITSGGIDGVLGTGDDIVIVRETDQIGEYLLTGIPAGPTSVSYDVSDLQAGYVPNSDLDGGSLVEATAVLSAGEIRLDVDFGIVGDVTITGTVWIDLDADGVIDLGEQGIPNVDVEVTWNGPDGPITTTVTTDADGRWGLTDIPPGDWTTQVVTSTVPDGLIPTTPTDGAVTVPPGGTGNVDNGFVPPGSIGDTVFNDPDRNGIQGPGETGVPSVVVILLDGDGNEIDRTTTGGDGTYTFDELPPGVYTVRVDSTTLPPGTIVVSDAADPVNNGETTVTLGPGQDRTDVDFGVASPRLPVSGANTMVILLLAGLALAIGVWLWSARRRPRATSS